MKRAVSLFFLSLMVSFGSLACHNPSPMDTYVVDDVEYAYEYGEWWVCGFQTEKDTIVLKSDVVINGKVEKVMGIHIVESPTSPKVLIVSDGYKSIYNLYLSRLETIYIPKTVTLVHEVCVGMYAAIVSDSLKTIVVDKKNRYIKSVDGVLYTKSGRMLLLYPPQKEGTEYVIPRKVKYISSVAFSGCRLKKVYHPKRRSMEQYDEYGGSLGCGDNAFGGSKEMMFVAR